VSSTPIIVCVGAHLRGDDTVGLVVAQQLRRSGVGLQVHEVTGDLTELLDIWDGASEVWVVDAVSSGQAPGTVVEIDLLAPDAPLPGASALRSSHALGVAEVLGLGRQLGRLPARLLAFGIEGAEFGLGRSLTAAVALAADELVRDILQRTRSAR
jgi:hydrogenase maturation protease